MSVPCLIDTGSMVSTIMESCFVQHFEPWGQEQLRSCSWLQLRAANGLSIPYIGYMELEVKLCGRIVTRCGVLVVRDPPGDLCSRVPGVLMMNVLGRCYQELFGHHGPALFNLSPVSNVPLLVFPHKILGTLVKDYIVSLLTGITDDRPITVSAYSQGTQVASSTVSEQIAALNLTALSEQGKVATLFSKYQMAFSEHDGDFVPVSSLTISQCLFLYGSDIAMYVLLSTRLLGPHVNQLLESQVIRDEL